MKFKCPKCGTVFTEQVDKCPNCGVTFSYPKKEEEIVEVELVEEEPQAETIEVKEVVVDDERTQMNKRNSILAFVFSLIGLETLLFPFSIVALALLARSDDIEQKPFRVFRRIAKPVAIVGLIVGPLVIGLLITVCILYPDFAQRLANYFERISDEFIKLM